MVLFVSWKYQKSDKVVKEQKYFDLREKRQEQASVFQDL